MHAALPAPKNPARRNPPPLHCANDSVREIGNAYSIRPDIDHPALPELWRENLRKRSPKKKAPEKKPGEKATPSGHRIDDFA